MIILDFMDYERPSVTADVNIPDKNIEINKRLEDKRTQVLLIRRKEPYKGNGPSWRIAGIENHRDTAKEKVFKNELKTLS